MQNENLTIMFSLVTQKVHFIAKLIISSSGRLSTTFQEEAGSHCSQIRFVLGAVQQQGTHSPNLTYNFRQQHLKRKGAQFKLLAISPGCKNYNSSYGWVPGKTIDEFWVEARSRYGNRMPSSNLLGFLLWQYTLGTK